VCRSSTGVCDPEEVCDGVNGSCPSDVLSGSSTVCRSSTGVCDPEEVCDGVNASCPTDESNICTAEGCSPGFWKTHTSLWDGGADDATTFIKTSTTWNGDLGIPSCDGLDLTNPIRDTLGETIATPRRGGPSSNTLFHLSACLASSDALEGFPYNDLGALIAEMQSACANGGSELEDLKNECAAANNHDEITIFCPLP